MTYFEREPLKPASTTEIDAALNRIECSADLLKIIACQLINTDDQHRLGGCLSLLADDLLAAHRRLGSDADKNQ